MDPFKHTSKQQKHTSSTSSYQSPSFLLGNNVQCSAFQLTSEVKDQLQLEEQRSVSKGGGAPNSPLPPREFKEITF